MELKNTSPKSIRTRLLLLTILTILPVIILIVFFNYRQLKTAEEVEIEKLKTLTQVIASEHSQIVEGARQLLLSLSASPEVKNLETGCSYYLSGVFSKYQRYNNIAVSDLRGNVVCSALKTPLRINISDRRFFQDALKTKEFTVGEYSISKTTNQAILTFGYPLLSNRQEIYGVVYTSLDLTWLSDLITNTDVEGQTILLVLDTNGVILARNPDSENWVGKSFPNDPLVTSLSKSSGIVETSGIDGVERLYSFQKIGAYESGPYAVVGRSKSVIIDEPIRNFKYLLTLTLVTSVLSISIGWFIGNSLIARQVEAISKINKLKEDFISLASHQIRTPLTGIRWLAEILLSPSSGKLSKKQRILVNDINASVNRLASLASTLLGMSKLESGQVVPKFRKASLATIIKESLTDLRPKIKAKKIKVNLRISSGASTINMDPKLIKQVYTNLLSNAIKYSKIRSSITIDVKRKENKIVSSIKDSGVGIPKKEQDNIFERFFRASNIARSNQEGVGLGLYLAKLIIEAHKGEIWFESREGRGSTFYFAIPANLV